MLALDDVVAGKGEVVTDEDARAEADADQEPLIVRVPEADHVVVAGVLGPEAQDPEEASAVRRDAEVLLRP